MTSAGGVSYTWDANGNLLNDGINTYTYDHANRLAAASKQGSSISYGYNGLGDRLQQTVGGVTNHFTMDLNAGLTQALSDGTNTYLYGAARIAQYGTGGAAYFLGDALGSVRHLTDDNGEVTLARSYEPYGQMVSSVGNGISKNGFTVE